MNRRIDRALHHVVPIENVAIKQDRLPDNLDVMSSPGQHENHDANETIERDRQPDDQNATNRPGHHGNHDANETIEWDHHPNELDAAIMPGRLVVAPETNQAILHHHVTSRDAIENQIMDLAMANSMATIDGELLRDVIIANMQGRHHAVAVIDPATSDRHMKSHAVSIVPITDLREAHDAMAIDGDLRSDDRGMTNTSVHPFNFLGGMAILDRRVTSHVAIMVQITDIRETHAMTTIDGDIRREVIIVDMLARHPIAVDTGTVISDRRMKSHAMCIVMVSGRQEAHIGMTNDGVHRSDDRSVTHTPVHLLMTLGGMVISDRHVTSHVAIMDLHEARAMTTIDGDIRHLHTTGDTNMADHPTVDSVNDLAISNRHANSLVATMTRISDRREVRDVKTMIEEVHHHLDRAVMKMTVRDEGNLSETTRGISARQTTVRGTNTTTVHARRVIAPLDQIPL